MVGIGADQMAQVNGIGEILVIVFQKQFDFGADAGLFRLIDFKPVNTVGNPAPGLFLAGFAGYDLHFFRHHESGIKTDPELPDQIGGRTVFLHVGDKVGGT